MNVLVTSARLPVALDEIRKLGRRGHRVFAADTLRTAPGRYSRWVTAGVHVAAPEYDPQRFVADVKQLVLARKIDLVVPCFEEVFYLARHLPELSEVVQVFASDLETLTRLHHKARFNALARELGVPAPESTLVSSADDLAAATRQYPRYVAKPVWSRGGLDVLTNWGPLAGALALDECHPTRERPWLVQEYVDGVDVCTCSIAQRGRVTAHCTYVHPREIEHAGGILFESVDDPETLGYAQRIVEATRYHGQLGFDFRRSARGLYALECNPRPTAGVHLMTDELLVDGMLAPPPPSPRVVPPGVRRMYASALIRDLVLHRERRKDDLAALFSDAHDVYAEQGDRFPALLQVFALLHVAAYRRRHPAPARRGTTLMAAYFDGISWDGSDIP
ncbi:MAG TPA: ATP-grasp domain-containing protein [Polyangia bacterium]|nr:ATP-grasp domain-containing protein [Polyangia bacterium]